MFYLTLRMSLKYSLIHEALIVLLCLNEIFKTFILITVNALHVGDSPTDRLNCRVIKGPSPQFITTM